MQKTRAVSLNLGTLIYRRTKAYLAQPHVVILIVLSVLLGFLVITPLVKVVSDSLVWSAADRRLVDYSVTPGSFATFHWERVLIGPLARLTFFRPLLNSVATSLGACFFALAIGMLLAWLVVRTDIPGRRIIGSFGIAPFIMPSWALANAWIVFLKNSAIGGYPGIFSYFTHIEMPDWVAYGPFPIMVTLGIHYSSLSFLLVSAALGAIDAQLEESGEVLGATRFLILRRITFPIVLPAIFAALVMTFTRALGNFGTPFYLGAPVGYRTLATQLYGNVTNRMVGDAWVIATLLILSTILLIYYSIRINKRSERYQTVSGKSSVRRQTSLGRWRWPIFAAACTFIMLVIIVPAILFCWQSLMMKAGKFDLHNITFHYWIGESDPNIAEGEPGILRQSLIMKALWNTLRLGFFSALFGSALGILLGYGIAKGKGSILSTTADQISFIPYLMPPIAIGAVYIAMFGRSWGLIPSLYGSFTLLVLAVMVKNLPFSSRAGISTMLQIGGELEQAGEVLGGSWMYCFRRIIAPLAMGGFVAGFLLTLIIAMKELDLVVFLVSPGNDVLSTAALALSAQGVPQLGSATIFLQLMCIYVAVFLATKFSKVDIARGFRF